LAHTLFVGERDEAKDLKHVPNASLDRMRVGVNGAEDDKRSGLLDRFFLGCCHKLRNDDSDGNATKEVVPSGGTLPRGVGEKADGGAKNVPESGLTGRELRPLGVERVEVVTKVRFGEGKGASGVAEGFLDELDRASAFGFFELTWAWGHGEGRGYYKKVDKEIDTCCEGAKHTEGVFRFYIARSSIESSKVL
jgi:hypothetical protein